MDVLTCKIREMSVKFCLGTRKVLVTPGHMVQSSSRIFFNLIRDCATRKAPIEKVVPFAPNELEKVMEFDSIM